jgi:HK97 gp10 family phage protein
MGDFDFKSTSFELKGFKELYRAINALPEVTKKKELEPILVRALEPMRVFAATLAPDDPATAAPYDLATSISVSTKQRSGRAKRDRALGKYDARAFMGPTGAGYPQAMFAEFGTGQRFWKPPGAAKSVGTMPAQPYMRPAYDSQKTVTLKIIGDLLGERLHLIAKKYGLKG